MKEAAVIGYVEGKKHKKLSANPQIVNFLQQALMETKQLGKTILT